jgi:sterol carrier protein 2
MNPGSLTSVFDDRTNPLDWSMEKMAEHRDIVAAPFAAQIFGNAGLEYCEKYGATELHMAMIGEKNHRHSALNPYSQFQQVYTLEQVVGSATVHGPLTKLQCCPTSDGGAAVVVASEAFVKARGLQDQAVEIVAQAMATDSSQPFRTGSSMEVAGIGMTRRAAAQVYEQSGVRPSQVGVVELHDCFSANELITYDGLGLCPTGEAHKMVDTKDNTFGGRVVVNPSGGLISKGHPLGATGLAQCSELVWQLRGWCEKRQVPHLHYALQHNIGLGGAVVISMYKKYNDKATNAQLPDGRDRVHYNPAVECKPVSVADVKRVTAETASDYFISKL